MNGEIRNMHKSFQLKIGRKWNTQKTICKWGYITNKDFVGMVSDYVDMFHLTQFTVVRGCCKNGNKHAGSKNGERL